MASPTSLPNPDEQEAPAREAGDESWNRALIEELLGRQSLELAPERASSTLRGRRVLVTGAGGSIGSALCRRLADLPLEGLLLLDRSEADLKDAASGLPDTVPVTLIGGDLLDDRTLERCRDHAPDFVFHAAALKHVVPLEEQAVEAAAVNTLGTARLMTAAASWGVRDFVLLSTDKAASPHSIMGATKRLAEILCREATTFRTVAARLVNVLGTRGSVLPRFRKHLAAGDPLLVTALDAERWFMTADEAVDFLLATSWLGEPGATLVPRMGDPLAIGQLARTVLKHAARAESALQVTGLGPGEKLREDLTGPHERLSPTALPDILQVRQDPADPPNLRWLNDLEAAVENKDPGRVVQVLRTVIRDYTPSDLALKTAAPDSALLP